MPRRRALTEGNQENEHFPEATRTNLTYLRFLLFESRVSIGGADSLFLLTMVDRRSVRIDPAGPRGVYANRNIYNHARL